MNDKQTYSSKTRALHKEWCRVFKQDEAYAVFYGKGFRRFYKNKPTKKYLWLLNEMHI